MEKHVLSDQTGFLSGQNLSLDGQITSLLTKVICRFESGSLQLIGQFRCDFTRYKTQVVVISCE